MLLHYCSDAQFSCLAKGFGELALLYNSPRACSVRATSDGAIVYGLGRIAFRQLVMNHQQGVKHGLEKYLATVPLLRDLSPVDIASLADITKTEDVKDGEYIVEIGEAADCLFLVLDGEVVCHRDGGEQEMMRLQAGDFFGESCLADSTHRPNKGLAVLGCRA